VKLHARLNQNAAVPTVASPLNLVAVGRKLDRIHNYEANFLEEDNQAISRRADRRGRSMCGVSCRCYGAALLWGNGFGSLRKSYKSPTTERSRGRHPRLRPLKRACWSDIIMVGSPRTGRMRRMMLPLSTRTTLLAGAVVTQRRRDGGSETPVHATSENA